METQLIMAENKKYILGQYFTKKEIVNREQKFNFENSFSDISCEE